MGAFEELALMVFLFISDKSPTGYSKSSRSIGSIECKIVCFLAPLVTIDIKVNFIFTASLYPRQT